MKSYHVSIDKVKVVFLLKKPWPAFTLAEDFEERCSLFLSYDRWFLDKTFSGSGMLSYRVNFSLREEGRREGVVFVGMIRNEYRSDESGAKQIMVEWNPNKTDFPRGLLFWLNSVGAEYGYTRSLDLAFDFQGFFPQDCRVFTRRRLNVYEDTIYVDFEANNGKIRIYDKSKERSLHGEKTDDQITRIEIRLKPPRYFETHRFATTSDVLYWQDICQRLREICIPTDFRRLLYDVEMDYGREANQATLFMLRQLDLPAREHALSLMGNNTAAFYRSLLKTGDVDRLDLDEYALHGVVSDLLNEVLAIVIDPPERQMSWYDARKLREQGNQHSEVNYYGRETIVSGIYDKLRSSKSAPLDLSRIQGESGSPCDSDPWEP